MKILTCRQPWAHLIVIGTKDIENRSKPTAYRGPVLIHAAKAVEWADYRLAYCLRSVPVEPVTGGVIGICELVDVVEESSSRWFSGPYGWVLSKPKRIPYLSLKGQLGLVEARGNLLRRLKLPAYYRT